MYIWGCFVSRLVDIHKKKGFGAPYAPPSGIDEGLIRATIVSILSFVDDCNLSNTGEKFETVRDILARTKSDAQLWNDLIRLTGGALELTKCFMQVIQFAFEKDGKPTIVREIPDTNVELIDRHNNKIVTIKPISAYTTYKSLGTIQGINEKNLRQFSVLAKKAQANTRALMAARITPYQAWLHHTLCFVPLVAYPLPACHLSEAQLHKLQSPYTAVLCNKLHLNRHHSRELLFGPVDFGGLRAIDLRIEAGISGIETIIRNLRTPGTAQSIVLLFLQTWQHTSGLTKPLMQYPQIYAPFLEGNHYK